MLKTCKLQDFKKEYENLLFANFSELYQRMKKDGHIPEEVYTRLGFPQDTNYAGEEVDKPDGISQEMRHRAKLLSHDLQRELRQKKEKAAIDGAKQKVHNELVICHDLYVRNDEAMKKMFPTGEVTPLLELQLTDFKKPSVKLLKAFVHLRLFTTGTIPNGQGSRIPKNKGSVDEAATGVKNLLWTAHDMRCHPIILPRPETNEAGEVLLDNNDGDGEGMVVDEDDDGGMEKDGEEDEGSNPPRLIVDSPHLIATVTPPRPKDKTECLPSHYLTNTAYLTLAQRNIRGTFRIEITPFAEDRKTFVDKLGHILHR